MSSLKIDSNILVENRGIGWVGGGGGGGGGHLLETFRKSSGTLSSSVRSSMQSIIEWMTGSK